MKFPEIRSISHPLIRKALMIKERDRTYRNGVFLVEGAHLIETALTAEAELKKVFFTGSFAAKREGQRLLRRIFKKASDRRLMSTDEGYREPLAVEVSPHVLSKLCDTETPQGIVAIVSCGRVALDGISFTGIPLLVICDGIQDPGNVGTIIRVSDAAGADAVITLPGTCDAFIPKAIRATAGSVFNLPVVRADSGTLLEYLESKNIPLFVTDVHGTVSLYKGNFSGPAAIAFGNEARGVSESVRAGAKSLLKIPIVGKAESLNVAMAASVCLYEVVRQRIHCGVITSMPD